MNLHVCLQHLALLPFTLVTTSVISHECCYNVPCRNTKLLYLILPVHSYQIVSETVSPSNFKTHNNHFCFPLLCRTLNLLTDAPRSCQQVGLWVFGCVRSLLTIMHTAANTDITETGGHFSILCESETISLSKPSALSAIPTHKKIKIKRDSCGCSANRMEEAEVTRAENGRSSVVKFSICPHDPEHVPLAFSRRYNNDRKAVNMLKQSDAREQPRVLHLCLSPVSASIDCSTTLRSFHTRTHFLC